LLLGVLLCLPLAACGGGGGSPEAAASTPSPSASLTGDAALAAAIEAASAGDSARVKQLVEGGVRPDAAGASGVTVLQVVAVKGDIKLIEFLLSRPGGVGSAALRGLLIDAPDDPAVIRALLAGGVSVNAAEKRNPQHSLLMLTAEVGHLKSGQALVEAGADLEQLDAYGDPAVSVAAFNGHLDFVKYLVGRGAALDKVGMYNRTAAGHARQAGHADIADWLVAHGAPEKD
jgi:ankyrin repeat protein